MRLYVPQSDAENTYIAGWLADQLKCSFSPPYLTMAVVLNDKIVGAVLFNDFNGTNIDLTAAGSFAPSIVRAIARYVFVQLKCSRVTLRTRRSNRHARKLLGRHFTFEATLKNWFGIEDAYQFRMCRDECPWLERKHEHSIAAAAA